MLKLLGRIIITVLPLIKPDEDDDNVINLINKVKGKMEKVFKEETF